MVHRRYPLANFIDFLERFGMEEIGIQGFHLEQSLPDVCVMAYISQEVNVNSEVLFGYERHLFTNGPVSISSYLIGNKLDIQG